MADGIAIDALDPTVLPSFDHEFPAMKDGLTVKLKVDQVRKLIAAIYDPQDIAGDAFDRTKHTGEQAIATITGLQAALDGKIPTTTVSLVGPDLNDTSIKNGVYYVSGAHSNTPGGNGFLFQQINSGGTIASQQYVVAATGVIWHRLLVSGVWSPWVIIYTQKNIVGTVSQSGGVPTGAIIERGSNANGEYTRFADGTLLAARLNIIMSTTAPDTWATVAGLVLPSSHIYPDGIPIAAVRSTPSSQGINVRASMATATTYNMSMLTPKTLVSNAEVNFFLFGRWY